MNTPKPLLSSHVKALKGAVSIISGCIQDVAGSNNLPDDIGKKFFSICLTEHHMEKVTSKLGMVMHLGHLTSVDVLTVDGSPHCLGLHHAVVHAQKISGFAGPVRHWVLEKGEWHRISPAAVKLSRHLSGIEKIIRNHASNENG